MKNYCSNILCSVCIATYRRPDLLEKLLDSLARQHRVEDRCYEIIVVDNDIRNSALPIANKFKNRQNLRLHYLSQVITNISLTRNMAVGKSAGTYILFIDDDEVAPSDWIYQHLRSMEKFSADGTFGPIYLEFNKHTPKWMKERKLFYPDVQNTGDKPEYMGTGNCCIKASLLQTTKEPFDIRYGTTGGEDTHLFRRLENEGRRFVFCKEAYVTEYLPPNRTNVSYLFVRGLKGGSAHTRRMIEFAEARKDWIRLLMISKSLFYGITSISLFFCFFWSPVHRTQWLIKLGSNIGRFMSAFGWHFQFYR